MNEGCWFMYYDVTCLKEWIKVHRVHGVAVNSLSDLTKSCNTVQRSLTSAGTSSEWTCVSFSEDVLKPSGSSMYFTLVVRAKRFRNKH